MTFLADFGLFLVFLYSIQLVKITLESHLGSNLNVERNDIMHTRPKLQTSSTSFFFHSRTLFDVPLPDHS